MRLSGKRKGSIPLRLKLIIGNRNRGSVRWEKIGRKNYNWRNCTISMLLIICSKRRSKGCMGSSLFNRLLAMTRIKKDSNLRDLVRKLKNKLQSTRSRIRNCRHKSLRLFLMKRRILKRKCLWRNWRRSWSKRRVGKSYFFVRFRRNRFWVSIGRPLWPSSTAISFQRRLWNNLPRKPWIDSSKRS